MIIHMELETH